MRTKMFVAILRCKKYLTVICLMFILMGLMISMRNTTSVTHGNICPNYPEQQLSHPEDSIIRPKNSSPTSDPPVKLIERPESQQKTNETLKKVVNEKTDDHQHREEILRALQDQRDLIVKELMNHTYPRGTNGINAGKLDDLLMDKKGRPIRNIIVTKMRSGSSFLGDVVNSHPGTWYTFEPLVHFFMLPQVRGSEIGKESLRVIRSMLKCQYNEIEDALQYQKQHAWFPKHNQRWWSQCEKHKSICWLSEFFSSLCRLFPFQAMKTVRLQLNLAKDLLKDPELNVRILYLVRDPRGTMKSRQPHKWCATDPDCYEPMFLCYDLESDFKAAAWMENQYPQRFRAIRYEDLAMDPVSTLESAFKFMGLDFSFGVRAFIANHTRNTKGDAYSTYRDSRSVAFQWRNSMKFREVDAIQTKCKRAMSMWGYNLARNETHLKTFYPLSDYTFI